jgi:hypothetical protein
MNTPVAASRRWLLTAVPLCFALSCATMPELVRHEHRPTNPLRCHAQLVGPQAATVETPQHELRVRSGTFPPGTGVRLVSRADNIAGVNLVVEPRTAAQVPMSLLIDIRRCPDANTGNWSIWQYPLAGGDTVSLPTYRWRHYMRTDSVRFNSGFMVAN